MAILKQILSAEPISLLFSTSEETFTGVTIGYKGFLDAINFYQQTLRLLKKNDLDGKLTTESA